MNYNKFLLSARPVGLMFDILGETGNNVVYPDMVLGSLSPRWYIMICNTHDMRLTGQETAIGDAAQFEVDASTDVTAR